MAAHVLSINLGRPVRHPDRLGLTAIDKLPSHSRVRVGPLGLEGDQVADVRHHGGVDQAVYAFAREDLDLWGGRLGGDLRNGLFGENLTTEGIDVNGSLIGEQWRIGTATFEVSDVRIPCNTFKRWIAASDFDDRGWVKRFTAEGRPGTFLRVLEPGRLSAGDELVVISRPDHDVTVSMLFRALMTDRELAADVLQARQHLSALALKALDAHAASA